MDAKPPEEPTKEPLLPVLRDVVARFYRGVQRHRTLGLAGEVAFFALFSFPPAFLALFGALGFVGHFIGTDLTNHVRSEVLIAAGHFFTPRLVDELVAKTIDALLVGGRIDVLSIGILFALWSASRASSALIEALNVIYNVDQRIALWRHRAVALLFTLVAIVSSAVLLPLLVVGPAFGRSLAGSFGFESTFVHAWELGYWPSTCVISILVLTTTYHFALPFRTPFVRDLPGACFAFILWILGSFALRSYARWSLDSSSLYGSVGAPMVFLLWLHFSTMSVLLGAELNSVIESIWPSVSAKEKRTVLKQAVAALTEQGEDVAPVSATGGNLRQRPGARRSD